jgi:hypothetical protein
MATSTFPAAAKPDSATIRSELYFTHTGSGAWLAERVWLVRGSVRRKSVSFAFIRPAMAASGLLDKAAGYVVTKNDFAAEPVYFDGDDALQNAKRHVEALFALEGF